MVHPRDLLRVDSNSGRADFMAPIDSVPQNQLDCGLTAAPCLNQAFKLDKYAKSGYFLTVLALIGLLQGIIIQYVRGTSKIWSQHYNINQDTVDWLVYLDEILIGFVALPIAFWGCRYKRPPWIGSLTILLSVSCLLLAVPEAYHQHVERPANATDTQLCVISHEGLNQEDNREVNFIGGAVLCTFEMFFAMASVSYITHGITYVDDNISILTSSSYIGLVIAMRELGKQIGIYASWIPLFFQLHGVFLSVVWICLLSLNLVVGILMVMFPKHLPSVIVNRSAVSILQSAAGSQQEEEAPVKEGLWDSINRVSKYNLLLISILSGLFVRAGMTNLAMFNKEYDQSRFLIKIGRDYSGFHEPPLVQFSTNLLKQPLVVLFALISGIYISRTKPKARSLFLWNIGVFSLVTVMFLTTAFVNCDQKIENELNDKVIAPYCSADCGCSGNIFEPVCLSSKTYFSPCMAGCTKVKYINKNQKIYEDCFCADSANKNVASEGSCDADTCNTLWALSQANNVLSSGLLASTLVINMVINMRIVAPEDKGMALALELTFISILPYLPIRAIYGAFSEFFCHYAEGTKCYFYSNTFGLFMSLATIFMASLSTVFATILLCKATKIELYEEQVDEEEVMMENFNTDNNNAGNANGNQTRLPNEAANSEEENNLLAERGVNHEDTPNVVEEVSTPQDNAPPSGPCRDSGVSETSHPSLRELEDVGDDHDSCLSIPDAITPKKEVTDPPGVMTRKTSNEQLVTDF